MTIRILSTNQLAIDYALFVKPIEFIHKKGNKIMVMIIYVIIAVIIFLMFLKNNGFFSSLLNAIFWPIYIVFAVIMTIGTFFYSARYNVKK